MGRTERDNKLPGHLCQVTSEAKDREGVCGRRRPWQVQTSSPEKGIDRSDLPNAEAGLFVKLKAFRQQGEESEQKRGTVCSGT